MTSASKYFETGMIWFLTVDNWNSECDLVMSPAKPFSRGRICLVKYPSHTKVTIEPEPNNDGTFRPMSSIDTEGHCKTALLITHCFVSLDMALLDSIFTNSSNFGLLTEDDRRSVEAPLLCLWPWEAGAFSLTHFVVVPDKLGIHIWLEAWHNFLSHGQCPYSSDSSDLGQFYHWNPLFLLMVVFLPRNGLLELLLLALLGLELQPVTFAAWSMFVKANYSEAGLRNSLIWECSATAWPSFVHRSFIWDDWVLIFLLCLVCFLDHGSSPSDSTSMDDVDTALEDALLIAHWQVHKTLANSFLIGQWHLGHL